MKIYTKDWGYDGAVVVIAESREQAARICQEEGVYYADAVVDLEEHEITPGFIVEFMGDR